MRERSLTEEEMEILKQYASEHHKRRTPERIKRNEELAEKWKKEDKTEFNIDLEDDLQ